MVFYLTPISYEQYCVPNMTIIPFINHFSRYTFASSNNFSISLLFHVIEFYYLSHILYSNHSNNERDRDGDFFYHKIEKFYFLRGLSVIIMVFWACMSSVNVSFILAQKLKNIDRTLVYN